MRYKYLFWDLDGTLLDSFEGCANSFQAVYDHYGLDIPRSQSRLYIGPPLQDTFAKLLPKDKVAEAVEVYREKYLKGGEQWNSKLFDGIPEVLAAVRECGYKIYLATSKGEGAAREILERYGIVHLFDGVFGADYRTGRVSKEQVLERAFDEVHCDKSQALMIGDSIYDAVGAKHIGIDCLACTYGFGIIEEMREVGIIGECNTPSELVEYLK